MENRFDLSWKNKEVRMWIYIMIPTAIIGFSILIFADYTYQSIASLVILSAWIIFYFWRLKYRKKKRLKLTSPSQSGRL
ncbi:hypothetical protein [Planococcus sp. 4-30]|uniref:hypothetical protein n=1 Tax=Planococcus TaxID=1372 RepID=UPI001CBEE84D|nr:hypothetical protein [Planococcus sp. 4-30]